MFGWPCVHHSITSLLLPTWYTNFLFIRINYIKLNSSKCFERNPLIIKRSTTQIVHVQPLVSSLSASDRLVQPLRKDSSITFLLLPTWYTSFMFIHINYIKLNSSTYFERNPLIIRRSTTQIVHMQPLVSSLSASDRLVQPLRKDWLVETFLSGCSRRSLAESDDTRGCICTICVADLLMMSGLRSKYVEEFNFI